MPRLEYDSENHLIRRPHWQMDDEREGNSEDHQIRRPHRQRDAQCEYVSADCTIRRPNRQRDARREYGSEDHLVLRSHRQSEVVEHPKLEVLSYTPGLIVYLHNLHPESTKAVITSFLTHNVHRYSIKYQRRELDCVQVTRAKEEANETPPDSISQRCVVECVIDYVDYKAKCGFTNAHIRVKSNQQADLLVRALQKRRRCMTSGNDLKGTKTKRSLNNPVKAVILHSDRERVYWEYMKRK